MNIDILQLTEGARQARGLAVIIDVFRAFSTACYVMANGASRIIPVGDAETAYKLKQKHPAFRLIGEDEGKKLKNFDYGNSPTEIETVDFSGRTVVHRSSAGTQGIVNAQHADEIITGSFCNVNAIINYIRSNDFEQVSLVCMGQATMIPAAEDTLCADTIKMILDGGTPNFAEIRAYLRNYESAQKFFDPTKEWAPERDFELCLDVGRFDFVLRLETDKDGYQSLHKIDLGLEQQG
jgi:2-phosphosulfolactate phosphatase